MPKGDKLWMNNESMNQKSVLSMRMWVRFCQTDRAWVTIMGGVHIT